ncbi:MAG: hypothetical protein AVDCRST_MAG60-1468, partial [uncultured Nocardioides sp.]
DDLLRRTDDLACRHLRRDHGRPVRAGRALRRPARREVGIRLGVARPERRPCLQRLSHDRACPDRSGRAGAAGNRDRAGCRHPRRDPRCRAGDGRGTGRAAHPGDGGGGVAERRCRARWATFCGARGDGAGSHQRPGHHSRTAGRTVPRAGRHVRRLERGSGRPDRRRDGPDRGRDAPGRAPGTRGSRPPAVRDRAGDRGRRPARHRADDRHPEPSRGCAGFSGHRAGVPRGRQAGQPRRRHPADHPEAQPRGARRRPRRADRPRRRRAGPDDRQRAGAAGAPRRRPGAAAAARPGRGDLEPDHRRRPGPRARRRPARSRRPAPGRPTRRPPDRRDAGRGHISQGRLQQGTAAAALYRPERHSWRLHAHRPWCRRDDV